MEKTFEEKLNELNKIVDKMNEGKLPLEEMLTYYKRAQELLKDLTLSIDKAKEEINKNL